MYSECHPPVDNGTIAVFYSFTVLKFDAVSCSFFPFSNKTNGFLSTDIDTVPFLKYWHHECQQGGILVMIIHT